MRGVQASVAGTGARTAASGEPANGPALLLVYARPGFQSSVRRCGRHGTPRTSLITGQHSVYPLEPQARARINSAFIAIFFTGAAIGSQVGSLAYRAAGCSVLCVFGGLLSVAALVYWLT